MTDFDSTYTFAICTGLQQMKDLVHMNLKGGGLDLRVSILATPTLAARPLTCGFQLRPFARFEPQLSTYSLPFSNQPPWTQLCDLQWQARFADEYASGHNSQFTILFTIHNSQLLKT